ncbi:hypothetical protein LR48_Vigan02g084400 [Vigna angularis]|uniref:Uncharacterized protein n=1 Tax=Phaseolus angularis TaxID=3914 RepID=A0A0L9TWY5_PHAAN|nr:hypothetical protein LR48_Vigan02g084400 [Vigna angularis]
MREMESEKESKSAKGEAEGTAQRHFTAERHSEGHGRSAEGQNGICVPKEEEIGRGEEIPRDWKKRRLQLGTPGHVGKTRRLRKEGEEHITKVPLSGILPLSAASTKPRHPWPSQRHASRTPLTQPSTVAVTAVPPPRCEPFLHHHISHLQRDKLKKPDAQGKLEQIRNGTPFFSNNKRQRGKNDAVQVVFSAAKQPYLGGERGGSEVAGGASVGGRERDGGQGDGGAKQLGKDCCACGGEKREKWTVHIEKIKKKHAIASVI